MMRLWLSRNAAECLREQLVTQLRLGILSGDLAAGERLPSVRDLGRRYEVHPNTVSAAYRELEGQAYLTFRKGSGVYVGNVHPPKAGPFQKMDLSAMAAEFLEQARARGFSADAVRAAIARAAHGKACERVLLVEPEPELCQILTAELTGRVGLPVVGHVLRRKLSNREVAGSAVVSILSRGSVVREALPVHIDLHLLRLRSVAEHFSGAERPAATALIGIASSSPEVLRRVRSLLGAVGVAPEALEFRDARETGWSRGLASCAFVIADVVTARRLPKNCTARVLRVLSDVSVDELGQALGAMPAAGRESRGKLQDRPRK